MIGEKSDGMEILIPKHLGYRELNELTVRHYEKAPRIERPFVFSIGELLNGSAYLKLSPY
jgi:hypothetical protein